MSLSTFFVQSKRQRQGKTGQVSWDSWSKTRKISCEKLSARRAWDPHTHTAAAYSAFANWQLICASATGHRTLWCFVFNPTAVRYGTGCPVGMGYSALELKFFSPGQWQAVASDIMEPGMGDEAQSVRTPSWLTRRVRGRLKFSGRVMALIWKFYMKYGTYFFTVAYFSYTLWSAFFFWGFSLFFCLFLCARLSCPVVLIDTH